MPTLLIFLITISILVAVHEFGHYLVARLCGVYVHCFSIGFGPKLIKYKTKKSGEFRLSLIPLGGYVKMMDSRTEEINSNELSLAFDHQAIYKRILIVLAGPIANFIFAFFLYWAVSLIGIPNYSTTAKISDVVASSPAQNAGLKRGDVILSYDETPYTDWNDFSQRVKKTAKIQLEIDRDGQQFSQNIFLEKKDKTGNYFLGIQPTRVNTPIYYNLVSGFVFSVENSWNIIIGTIKSLFQLIIGTVGLDQLSGPISIASAANEMSNAGLSHFLLFLGLISINLGVINLVPLPMLDGGHILLLIIETFRGKSLSKKIQERFLRFGFILLIGIMSIAFFNDFNHMR